MPETQLQTRRAFQVFYRSSSLVHGSYKRRKLASSNAKADHRQRSTPRLLAVMATSLWLLGLPASAKAKGASTGGEIATTDPVSGLLPLIDPNQQQPKLDQTPAYFPAKGHGSAPPKAPKSPPKEPDRTPAAPKENQTPPPISPTGDGIDVSEANGDIDWQAVKNSGHGWAIVKATEGLSSTDEQLSGREVDAMRAAGVTPGFYHFARPQDGRTGAQEADHFLDTVKAAGGLKRSDIIPVLDIELTKLDPVKTFDYVHSFVDHVRDRTGLPTLIYTYYYFWRDQVEDRGDLFGSSVWVASYGSNPRVPGGWGSESIWQYSDSGSVTGISGQVDLDHVTATVPVADKAAFEEKPTPGPTAEPPAQVPPQAVPAPTRTMVSARKSRRSWALNPLAAIGMLFSLIVLRPLFRLDPRRRRAYVGAWAKVPGDLAAHATLVGEAARVEKAALYLRLARSRGLAPPGPVPLFKSSIGLVGETARRCVACLKQVTAAARPSTKVMRAGVARLRLVPSRSAALLKDKVGLVIRGAAACFNRAIPTLGASRAPVDGLIETARIEGAVLYIRLTRMGHARAQPAHRVERTLRAHAPVHVKQRPARRPYIAAWAPQGHARRPRHTGRGESVRLPLPSATVANTTTMPY